MFYNTSAFEYNDGPDLTFIVVSPFENWFGLNLMIFMNNGRNPRHRVLVKQCEMFPPTVKRASAYEI